MHVFLEVRIELPELLMHCHIFGIEMKDLIPTLGIELIELLFYSSIFGIELKELIDIFQH